LNHCPGHYARLEYQPRLKLLSAADKRKDQSYYLSTTSAEILRRTLFPLGALTKAEVRSIARDLGFVNAQKKESMGVCFVEPSIRKGHFNTFLGVYLSGLYVIIFLLHYCSPTTYFLKPNISTNARVTSLVRMGGY
jgi:tRNA U34 2-thiouridine synthase MnmA/TrmU